MSDAREILLAHHLKALKRPTLPHASIRSWPAHARRKGWTMSDTWHGLSNSK